MLLAYLFGCLLLMCIIMHLVLLCRCVTNTYLFAVGCIISCWSRAVLPKPCRCNKFKFYRNMPFDTNGLCNVMCVNLLSSINFSLMSTCKCLRYSLKAFIIGIIITCAHSIYSIYFDFTPLTTVIFCSYLFPFFIT